MFHQLPSTLEKIKTEEEKLTVMISALQVNLSHLLSDFDTLVSKTDSLLKLYHDMGNLYSLNYKDELGFAYKNLSTGFKLVRDIIADTSLFLTQPVVSFIDLHNQQTSNLLKFISNNQQAKSALGKLNKYISSHKPEFAQEMVNDNRKLTAYLNHVTHNQFKNFFLLKSRDAMLLFGKEIQRYIFKLDEVF